MLKIEIDAFEYFLEILNSLFVKLKMIFFLKMLNTKYYQINQLLNLIFAQNFLCKKLIKKPTNICYLPLNLIKIVFLFQSKLKN